jgi:tetratricopeptide (TPR) repeat protein
VLLFRRAAPVFSSVGGDPDRLAEASLALEAAGNRRRAAEAEILLVRSLWAQGRLELREVHQERADRLLAGEPPSRVHALALTMRASTTTLDGDAAAALELATEAYELAERFGWREETILALMQIGTVRGMLGDARGLDDLTRAAELAQTAGLLGPLTRALNNLAVQQLVLGDVRGSTESRLAAAGVAEQIGSEEERRWSQGVLADHHYRVGRWDDALRLCDEFLAEPTHYLSGQAWIVRGAIRSAHGDVAGALADAEKAVAHARRIGQPQVLHFLLPFAAYVFATSGAPERAELLAREYLDVLKSDQPLQFGVIAIAAFAAAARLLDLDTELFQALAGRARSPWIDAARAYASGEYIDAASALARIGTRPEEAETRLRAAEQLATQGRPEEAEEQLQQARAFYESVDATVHLRSAEQPSLPSDQTRSIAASQGELQP